MATTGAMGQDGILNNLHRETISCVDAFPPAKVRARNTLLFQRNKKETKQISDDKDAESVYKNLLGTYMKLPYEPETEINENVHRWPTTLPLLKTKVKASPTPPPRSTMTELGTVPGCCGYHRKQYLQRLNLDYSPEPVYPKVFHYPDIFERHVNRTMQFQSQSQLPLSTLSVRWQNKRDDVGYDPQTLEEILTKFGPVRDLMMTGPCSARVVFENLSDCCEVMLTSAIGRVENRLKTHWWHKCMTNKMFLMRPRGLAVKYDNFVYNYNRY
ncbi:uncharacterized protein LOC106172918 [Lingula anatina]|uniref:Uncharacterized protein LOC106172918 n=1 Tax=Lingula anatina TaxID=7574 RepID=A0A1S3JFX6_LINAN|nr:uncharacterized protein LOC106172918 [Lingula anatina]|eukprot:XP_013409302.1 uncharacterized protein LOC106172918 [Lingula anatina]